jgi:hypothetical protein
MPSWSEVEEYKGLDARYRQARSDFERMEAAYLEALSRDPNDPGLKVTHAKLQRAEQEVQSLWSQLMAQRQSFAATKQSGV